MAIGSFDQYVTVAHRGKSARDLVELAVDALKGVSASDRQHLEDAFGITTIGDLGRHPFMSTARAMVEDALPVEHDPGPDTAWSEFFARAPLGTYERHPNQFRLDFGPVYYRGRLNGTARVLIVGQDPAANELVGHRAFVGASGQRVQGFLRRLGIGRDYLMVNTFLYPVFGQFLGKLRTLTSDTDILEFRNALFDFAADRNKFEAVIAVGSAARDAIERWPRSADHTVQHITHPSARDNTALLANWNVGLDQLRKVVKPEAQGVIDNSQYGNDFTDADHVPIPRFDLPFGVPPWHGVGSHAQRDRLPDRTTNHKAIVWRAP